MIADCHALAVRGLDRPLAVPDSFQEVTARAVRRDGRLLVVLRLDQAETWWAVVEDADSYRLQKRVEPPQDPVARAIAGAANAPLSSRQKQELAWLARQAWAVASRESGESFDDWRHEQVLQAVGEPGLTACRQRHFKTLRGHFMDVLGRGSRRDVFRDFLGAENGQQDRELAMAKLQHLEREVKDVIPAPIQYAEGMLKRRGVRCLGDATVQQLWHCAMMLRKRALQLRRQGGPS